MADYPNLDYDALPAAIENALTAMADAQQHIALPPRRLDLEKARVQLERAMKERSS